jgi:hypothetical protein
LVEDLALPATKGVYQAAALLVLLAAIGVTQLAALEKRAIGLLAAGIADVLLASSLCSGFGPVGWFLLLCALAAAVGSLFARPGAPFPGCHGAPCRGRQATVLAGYIGSCGRFACRPKRLPNNPA